MSNLPNFMLQLTEKKNNNTEGAKKKVMLGQEQRPHP